MKRNEIVESLTNFLLSEDINASASAVNCYNYWAQKNKIIIDDPKVACWTLNLLREMLKTDKQFLNTFINN